MKDTRRYQMISLSIAHKYDTHAYVCVRAFLTTIPPTLFHLKLQTKDDKQFIHHLQRYIFFR